MTEININATRKRSPKERFIFCGVCSKPIFFGDPVFSFSGLCGKYCSAECFAAVHGEEDELTDEIAEDSGCMVYTLQSLEERITKCNAQIESASLSEKELREEVNRLLKLKELLTKLNNENDDNE